MEAWCDEMNKRMRAGPMRDPEADLAPEKLTKNRECTVEKAERPCKSLMRATLRQHNQCIMYLVLVEKVDVNAMEKIGHRGLHDFTNKSALHLACETIEGDDDAYWDMSEDSEEYAFDEFGGNRIPRFATINTLLALGADINARDSDGCTPIFNLLGWPGNQDILEETFLKEGARLDVMDNDGNSPLHSCVHHGLDGYLPTLLKKGANINAKNNKGQTPLHMVRPREDRQEAERAFEEACGVPSPAGIEFKSCVTILVEAGAAVNALDDVGMTPLCRAAEMGELNAVKLLVRAGANVNAGTDKWGNPPFTIAIRAEWKLAEFLAKHGADVRAKNKENGKTPFLYAAGAGGDKVLRPLFALIKAKKSPIKAKKPPLGLCSSLTETDNEGNAAIHLSLEYDGSDWGRFGGAFSANCTKILIELGADLNLKNGKGESPLAIAARTGVVQNVELLLSRGADANLKNPNTGQAPLHVAAGLGHKDCVDKLILGQIIKVDELDNDKETPLHKAASGNHHDTILRLLKAGGSVAVVNKEGKKPVDLATDEKCVADLQVQAS